MLHAQERALEVDVEHALPLVVGAVDDRGARLDRRAAHEHVEPAVAVAGGGVDHRRDVLLVRARRTATAIGACPPADHRVGDPLRRRFVDVGDDDAAALAAARRCDDRLAEAGRAAGDEAIRPPKRPSTAVIGSAASPPSAGITAPDVYAERSLARNSAMPATSSAVPSRCSGMFPSSPSMKPSPSCISSAPCGTAGVSIEPGAITLARTVGPYSAAICWVERDQPGLRRAVRGVALGADEPEHRRGVDDAAAVARRADAGIAARHAQKIGVEVRRDREVPLAPRCSRRAARTSARRRCCRGRRVGRSARSPRRPSRRSRRGARRRRARRWPCCPPARRASTVSRRAVVVDVGDDDAGAVLGEQHRRRPALARRRAGDQRDLAVEQTQLRHAPDGTRTLTRASTSAPVGCPDVPNELPDAVFHRDRDRFVPTELAARPVGPERAARWSVRGAARPAARPARRRTAGRASSA